MVRTRTSGGAAEVEAYVNPKTRGRKKKAVVIDLDGEGGLPAAKQDIEKEKHGPARAETVPPVDSPISVLESEPQLTQEMLEEEKQLQEERAAAADDPGEKPQQAGARPSSGHLLDKLDELLNKTKCFTKFLHERMDEVANEDSPADDAKPGKRRKASAKPQQPAKKRHVNTDYEEYVSEGEEDDSLKIQQLQKEIAPLVTGGTLKSYQLKGVKWMMSLYQNGLNGILADQMGLGKTVQTIAFLAHLRGNGVGGPFLIIAPLSTLSNWIKEFKRWCPSLNSLLYHGTKADRAEKRRKHMPRQGKSLPMIVTSYEVVMADISFLRNYKWTYVIVDEGHRLKNYDCKLFRELKRLHIENCLLLTGTPLQNNLPELWSLLHFILPDIFTSLAEFKAWFAVADRQNMKEEERDETRLEIIGKLHEILRPFLLRRMKSEVEKTLPKKKEVILYAPMADMQKTYYHNLLKRTLEQFLEENRSNPGTRKKQLNNICMQLRKNCNHPDLLRQEIDASYFFPPVDQLLGECGKLRLLDRLLGHLKSRGHRVLIFSQMTKLLDIIDYYMEQRGFDAFRIDGGVKQEERQAQIQKFEEGEGFAFLLSTRAGGLGINLTSADTAIIYDSDWNPQMDLQAMDRCHRIGQTKPVHVYRLLTAQSVECRMMKVANSKLHLETIVIDKGQFRQEQDNPKVTLSESDLMALLKDERTEEEELVQSAEISDENLVQLLDRSDMEEEFAGPEFPPKGPGWEVSVNKAGGQGLLSSVEGYRKVNS